MKPSLIGIASVLTIIVVFALMAGCRKTETVQQATFFTDHTFLLGSHQNKHLECLGEIYAFTRLLVKMERTEHPVFTKPDTYYLACMRAKGMVF